MARGFRPNNFEKNVTYVKKAKNDIIKTQTIKQKKIT